MMDARTGVVSLEYEGAKLSDERLHRRLGRIVEAIGADPSASFPNAIASQAELEGFYRFLRNDRVSFEELLAPHIAATYARAAEHESVLVIHDTTTFSFQGESREGLGKIQRSARGFFGHFALALAPGESRAPLGVMGVHAWVRSEETPTSKRRKKKLTHRQVSSLPSEQMRWHELVDDVEDDGDQRLIHVMDSEADDYKLLATLSERKRRFVIRLCYDRMLVDEDDRLKAHMACPRSVCTRDVILSRRPKKSGYYLNKRTAPRKERRAKLAIAAAPVTLKRSASSSSREPKTTTINVVRVWEKNPPKKFEPVAWLLATTEPIDTREQIERVVDAYRARWVIEEFFKAIKTGCAYEKRQLESWTTLLNALGLFIPIAWNLLRLRTLQREAPNKKARQFLTDTQLRVLALSVKPPPPKNPTVQEVLAAIGRLGGHLRSNGPPGWQVLGRGYTKLLEREVGLRLAFQEKM